MAIPVFSRKYIIDEMAKLADLEKQEATYLRSLIFINCGGSLDMTAFPLYRDRKEVKIYMIDSHRPYQHRNVNEDLNRVFVIHDGCRSFAECPSKADETLKE